MYDRRISMKLIPALACSALLLGGAAFAADSGSAGGSTPAASTAKPAAKSMDDCAKQAKEQKLKGKARTKFLKTCRADKK
jgi:hypothetical protein